MSSYLVTGGAGFIGSNITHALVERGDRVRILDNFSTGREENIKDLEGKIEIIHGDITNPETVAKAMEGIEYIFHEAALPSVQRSVEDPLESDRNNTFGTLMILNEARKAGVKRVVYAASSSAYGETPTLPKIEHMKPEPLSPYAVSKLAGELYAKAFHKTYGLETVALRYFNVFGPRQDPKSHYAAVIPKFIQAGLKGEPVIIFGDGEQSRDFCYIENVVQANLLAAQTPNAAGKMFNIACGERTTLLETVQQLSTILGKPLTVEHRAERAGDIKHSLADITEAKTILGYEPKIKFAEGLKKTFEWYRMHS